jgi:hypothetical protein
MEIKWSDLHSTENYKVASRRGRVSGWVVLIDDKWIARSPDASIRAEFDTTQEAQDFLTTMLSVQGENT